jgi:hypothetical protein
VTTLAVVGDRLTTIAGAEVAVIKAAAVFVPSVTEVEVRVTVVVLLVKWKCLNFTHCSLSIAEKSAVHNYGQFQKFRTTRQLI